MKEEGNNKDKNKDNRIESLRQINGNKIWPLKKHIYMLFQKRE